MATAATQIHPSVILGQKIRLGQNVKIGAYSIIEDGAVIGEGTTILNNVYIGEKVQIGNHNTFFTGSILGHEAQNKSSIGIKGLLKIGDHNVFREYVTIHSGSAEDSTTQIGNHNYFMTFAHVGHDCVIQDHVTVTSGVLIGGHVVLENGSVLGGGCGVHQYCRIGSYAMIGGRATVTKDVPPYMLIDDNESLIGSFNVFGLRRANFSEKDKSDIKKAYRLLYLSGLNTSQAVNELHKLCGGESVEKLIKFIGVSKRGILGHRACGFSKRGQWMNGKTFAEVH